MRALRLFVAGAAIWAGACRAQDAVAPAAAPGPIDLTWRRLPQRVFSGQCLLFGSPFHAHKRDLAWIVPFGLLAGATIASDHHNFSAHVHSTPSTIQTSDALANVSLASLVAIPSAMAGSDICITLPA